jgi:hypothetical protein
MNLIEIKKTLYYHVVMTRLEKFESLQNHPWLKKSWGKLKTVEREIARQFLNENAQLDRGQFEFKVNRMFLDQPNKPKNWTIILELLANANSGY